MKTQFPATSLVIVLLSMLLCSAARADSLTGLSDVTVVGDVIVSLRYAGTEYVVANDDLMLGTTTRWYIPADTGIPTLWVEGDPTPAATTTAGAPPKPEDPGSEGDNFFFRLNGANNMSSIDAINFQETIFPVLTNTIFVFERGGNDTGTYQAILADGSLGAAVPFNGATDYANTGVNVAGQNAFGVVFTTDVRVKGVRITAPGHDCLSISALPVVPDFAHRPSPADGALHDQTWVTLGWSAGKSAVSHDVYLGDNFDDVNNGTGGTLWANQTETRLFVGFPGCPYPDGLVPGTTYYWRIDEVNEADPNSPWKGNVWNFSIAPNTAYDPVPADGAGSVALNTTLKWTTGYGAKLHTVYFGDNFDDVNNAAAGAVSGSTTHNPGRLQRQKVYYWRVDEFDGVATYKGQVWSFATVGAVGSPYPANGAADAEMNAILTWAPGDDAASHQVYFGTDKETLRKADATSPEYKGVKALGAESYDPGLLAWDSTYYWRIDEVNNTSPASPWKGPLWSFTTGDYLLVDGFESYNDIDPPDPQSHRIFETWIDGYGTTTNGALVGNNLPPYAGRTIIHSGVQSMPLSYDNNLKFSEATMTLTGVARDWTRQGVAELSLWFRGAATNAAERMYVALNGTAVVYNNDTSLTQKTAWTEWVIPLQQFTSLGVNLSNVTSISIGVGTKGNTTVAGGTGTMYIDDIRLYRP
jgi:hypothetical protein